ncbi:hypothetical protein NATSA_11450 [Natronogracilivirgula saccharolytica]|uniref:Uncharacterized protein n=2 Tax=Natronogracilivirga saccharolytica TaxID=2812953 RepID=A0A8J7SA70_9BACT|nr:hypothetical protein [Natronogracilivirga saccharolytica]
MSNTIMKKILFRLSPMAGYLLLHYLWSQSKNDFDAGTFLEVTFAIIIGSIFVVYLTVKEEKKNKPDS